MASRTQSGGRCILCGGSPVTRAHVIARPIRDALPKGTSARDVISRTIDVEWPRRSELRTWERGSDILDVQPRVLCAPCNNHWMSKLEDAAAPVVASMIKGAAFDLTSSGLQTLSEWALAATIVRGEVVRDIRSVDRELAQSFREDGIADLPVAVGFVRLEWPSDIRPTGPVAWSYFYDVLGGMDGQVAVFWFHHVGVVVATQDFAHGVARGLRVLQNAALQAWPSPGAGGWPPTGSAADRTLLRTIGIPVDKMPRQSFDLRNMGRGRATIDAFVLPNVFGAGPFHDAAHELVARKMAEPPPPKNDA